MLDQMTGRAVESSLGQFNQVFSQIAALAAAVVLGLSPGSIDAQTSCESFASGPFINIQTPPCDKSCGTPVSPGFEVFGNEAYLFDTIQGSEYTIDFCAGYSAATWPAVITVALSDDVGGAVPGSTVAFAAGCSLTFKAPTTDTHVIVISVDGDCGGANVPTENGLLSVDCGPGGASCTGPCDSFASGPFINIQTPPCDESCGTPVVPGFDVFGNEAYLFDTIQGSEYTIDFCTGYSASTWPAVITVALSDDLGGAVPGSAIAFALGCSLTFTAPTTDTHVVVISVDGGCGGASVPTGNGQLTADCGPGGASCTGPCDSFASGPFINIQTPPCDKSCGTPVSPGFEVFGNEAYLFDTIQGSEYTIDFCAGYSAATWPAVITVALSDDVGGAVPGSAIAFAAGCSLTFKAPTTDTHVVVISVDGDCGGANVPTENGLLSVDCGPSGASCTGPCDSFASGPFVNIQTPPCGESCGTPVVPGFEVFGNEAYLFDTIRESEYTIDFCTGYSAATWPALITVAVSDDAGGAVPGSAIAFALGCSLTFTALTTDTHVIVVAVDGDCGGASVPTDNGQLTADCGPSGAYCSDPSLIFADGFESGSTALWTDTIPGSKRRVVFTPDSLGYTVEKRVPMNLKSSSQNRPEGLGPEVRKICPGSMALASGGRKVGMTSLTQRRFLPIPRPDEPDIN